MLNKVLPVVPFQSPICASVKVPGSKSISNRALLLSAMTGGKVKLKGILKSEDVELMIQALALIGVPIESSWEDDYVIINGCKRIISPQE